MLGEGNELQTTAPVNGNVATLAAFWSAVLATLVGSMIPAATTSRFCSFPVGEGRQEDAGRNGSGKFGAIRPDFCPRIGGTPGSSRNAAKGRECALIRARGGPCRQT